MTSVDIPDWPALMDAPTAAAYLSISESSFRFVARVQGVKPVDMGLATVRWRRKDLDGLIDRLPARGANIHAATPAIQDPAEVALVRARRRARA